MVCECVYCGETLKQNVRILLNAGDGKQCSPFERVNAIFDYVCIILCLLFFFSGNLFIITRRKKKMKNLLLLTMENCVYSLSVLLLSSLINVRIHAFFSQI